MMKMPKGTYSIPAKEGIMTLAVTTITAILIEIDANIILILASFVITIVMASLCMLYCYSMQLKYLVKKLRRKERKTLD